MVKAVVAGVGRMGRRHIQAVRLLGLDLAGVFDLNRESLKLARDEQAVPEDLLLDDLDELYATKPECVIIATTADSHCALACLAAERGAKYILVEKPLAVSLEQCDRMMRTCERHGARLAVNHQMRFMEQYTQTKELCSSEVFGGLRTMTVIGGNIGFSMNGTHYFEAFRFMTDEPVVEVTAWFSSEEVPNPRGAQFKDRAGSLRAVTASGRRLYMDIGADQGHGVRAVYGCSSGMITVNELDGELLATAREAQYRDLPTTRYGMPAVSIQRAIQPAEVIATSAAVLKALLNDVNSVSAKDGRRAVEVLVGAYQSAEQGGVPVRLDEKLDLERVFPWA